MNLNRNLTKTVLAVTVALTTLGTSTAALAATGGPAASAAKAPAARERVVKEGLYAAGFNAAVAKAHGYKIVTYANGDQQSVPINPKSHLPKGPIVVRGARESHFSNSDYNKVVGNCGTSWIAVLQTGTNNVQVGTGFTVSLPAIDYSWSVQLSDANGTSHQTAGGGLAFRSTWARTWTNLYQYEWTFDYVNAGQAELEDGTICFSGGPDVSISGLN